MDKTLWNRSFTDAACPPWPCPTCGSGVVVLLPDQLREQMTKESAKHQAEEWWGFEHVALTFSAWGECANKQCGEQFVISGDGYVDQVPTGEDMTDYEYVSFFTPRFISPTLRLCSLPENCPKEVVDAMHAAFALFWQSKPAAAGRIRVSLERLLDHLGSPSRTKENNLISLGHRIEQFSKANPDHGTHLLALKWLGNVGSHTAVVETNDLLDAFEVFEHVLAELIGTKSAAVAKLSERLIEKYGR